MSPAVTDTDRLISFTLPDRDVRGRAVRLGPALELILAAHAYPTPIRALLAEALVLTALMGTLRKEEESQLTLQAQNEHGIVDLLVCDYRDGELRGERYQGVVPLEGASLTAACEAYFAQSEQVPTLIRVATRVDGGQCSAGGLLVQHMPPVGESHQEGGVAPLPQEAGPDWEHAQILAASIRSDELTDAALPLKDLLWRLYHEEREVRVLATEALSRGCRCTAEYYQKVLAKFPEDELAHMRNEAGIIPVDCAFCSRIFEIKL